MRLAQQSLPAPTVAPTTTRLQDRTLVIARSLWGAMFGVSFGLFVLGAPGALQTASLLSDATRQELITRGIDPAFPARYLITVDTVTMLAFATIALLLVWRQPDDWMVMLSSLTLVGTAMLYTAPGHDAPVPFWIPAVAIALGEWDGQAALRLTVQADEQSKRYGWIALDDRKNGAPYSLQERQLLGQIAQKVARALEQDADADRD